MEIKFNIFRNISKDKLFNYLNIEYSYKIKKPELEEKILNKINNNKLEIKRFYKTFEKEIALTPYELEETLHCSKTERLRWQKENKFKIIDMIPFKYGSYPVFSRYQIEYLISSEDVDNWRIEYKSTKKGHTIESINKAKETKEKRKNKKKEIIDYINKQKIKWFAKDYILSATFELAYWTVWISRLAKTYQKKSYVGREKNKEKYLNLEQECYKIKNKAIIELLKSPYAEISFYRPENPHKIHFLLCQEHYEDFTLNRSFYDYGEYSAWDYLLENIKYIKKCKDCHYEEEKDYYSLYYLEIKDKDFPDISFSFHTPYPIGKEYFGNPKKLKQVHHEEQEGMFRFGRSLEDEENYIFTLAFVTKEYKKALEKYQHTLSNTKEI